jgi:hypothetical protein
MTENQNKDQLNIKVDIDQDYIEYQVKQRTKDIEDKLKEAESALTIIADKELQKQAKIYGCEPTVEAVTFAKTRGSTALLSSQQITGNNNNDNEGFDSTEDAIIALNKASKSGNKKATEIINKMGKKVLEKPINIEYNGKISDLARKPIKGHSETPENYDIRIADYQKKQVWKNLNSVSEDGDI